MLVTSLQESMLVTSLLSCTGCHRYKNSPALVQEYGVSGVLLNLPCGTGSASGTDAALQRA
jgi:hypothetical protein